MQGFEYPSTRHIRRHGPIGYSNYESYRDWLRDEFEFRCVYCLQREKWCNRVTTFHIDHSVPVISCPSRKCDYTNLLYSCSTCNSAKKDILGLADPCSIPFSQCLQVLSNGEVEALSIEGERLLEVLRLNNKSNVSCRSRWIRTLIALQLKEPSLYQEYMGYPDDLPDLRPPRKCPPNNSFPEGALNCFFAQRERGDLPTIY